MPVNHVHPFRFWIHPRSVPRSDPVGFGSRPLGLTRVDPVQTREGKERRPAPSTCGGTYFVVQSEREKEVQPPS